MKKINITQNILYCKYITEKLSPTQIAKDLNVSVSTIYKYVEKFGFTKVYHRVKNIENKKVGRLTVVKLHHKKNNTTYWECQCECGKITVVSKTQLYINKNTNKPRTQSCGCLQKEICYKRGKNGYKDVWGQFLNDIKNGAKHRNIEFNITAKELYELIEKQNWKCALSGILLILPKTYEENKLGKFNASVDRINSKKGYIIDNVQWVDRRINYMKQSYPQEEFVFLCKQVAEYQLCLH